MFTNNLDINNLDDSFVSLGYTVSRFTDPGIALQKFRVTPQKYDLVITDMTMPGLTGDQFALEILSIRSDIPIVLCTGYNENINEEKAKELGITEFVNKPVAVSDMGQIVRSLLDRDLIKP